MSRVKQYICSTATVLACALSHASQISTVSVTMDGLPPMSLGNPSTCSLEVIPQRGDVFSAGFGFTSDGPLTFSTPSSIQDASASCSVANNFSITASSSGPYVAAVSYNVFILQPDPGETVGASGTVTISGESGVANVCLDTCESFGGDGTFIWSLSYTNNTGLFDFQVPLIVALYLGFSSPVPEPATLAMLLLGLSGIGAAKRARRH